MKTPEIDIEELKKLKEENFKQRLEFIDTYAEWLKKTKNKEWSRQQKKLIDINNHQSSLPRYARSL